MSVEPLRMNAGRLPHPRPRPTVVFDGTVLGAGPATGVPVAFLTALRAYARSTTWRSVLLLPRGFAAPPDLAVDVVEMAAGAAARQWHGPRLLRRLDARVLHSPVAALPLRCPCARIATLHDLPWCAPERLAESGNGWRHRLAARLALRHADAVLVPTRAVADDVVQWAGTRHHAHLRVVPHGIDLPPTPADADRLTGPFLVLADSRPRKNLPRVQAAHATAARAVPRLPALRIVGPGHGWVPETAKAELLRSSRAVLVLSLHEGFGLPVLEGFAHGVPVVCSDLPALREVAGDAALRADPTDVAAMAVAIARVHRDEALRTRLRERGRRRAAQHPPERAAEAWQRLHDELRR